MKKILMFATVAIIGLALGGCGSSEEDKRSTIDDREGSIYGFVTESGSAEPMRAMRVELWVYDNYLTGTVTSDDGQYEFSNLDPNNYYELRVNAEGYEELVYPITIEGNQHRRADLQLKKIKTFLTVRTLNASNVNGLSATLNGAVSYDEGSDNSHRITEVGFIYSLASNTDNGTRIKGKLDESTMTFSVELSNLSAGIYRVQAYSTNNKGTALGEERQFEITGNPAVSTLEATNVKSTTATLNGKIEYEGSPAYTERGFVYSSTHPTPTVDGAGSATTKVAVTGSSLNFSANVKELKPDVTYHVRAYITNGNGTFYGETIDLTTTSTLPSVKTLTVTNVLANTATLNGKIESAGEPVYTERGFVYSRSYNLPTVSDPESATTKVVVSGSGTDFSANVASLMENSTYYVRAYATNVKGTAYGEVVTFVPKAILPVVTTLEVTNIQPTSATLNGRIDNAGEPVYIERGFVYSNSYETPTISDPTSATKKVVVSGTSKEFSANISSLTSDKTYYARAYATSSKGTTYGGIVKFMPESKKFMTIEYLMVQLTDIASSATWDQANSLCKKSTIGGFTDWRLPTTAELQILYKYKKTIGGFTDASESDLYWSSDYAGYKYNKTTGMWICDVYTAFSFYNGLRVNYDETYGFHVRAVRTVK